MRDARLIVLDAAQEAVATLGLLQPDAVGTIAGLLDPEMREHPRAIATAFRKTGVQLADVDKRALGIGTNAFLSKAALEEIAPLGLGDPLVAHELTLLRATFTIARAQRVSQEAALKEQLGLAFVGFEHECVGRDCPACNRVDGRVTRAAEAFVMPPVDCVAKCTGNYAIRAKIDWLAGIE